jgi:hypothetical protein
LYTTYAAATSSDTTTSTTTVTMAAKMAAQCRRSSSCTSGHGGARCETVGQADGRHNSMHSGGTQTWRDCRDAYPSAQNVYVWSAVPAGGHHQYVAGQRAAQHAADKDCDVRNRRRLVVSTLHVWLVNKRVSCCR